MPTPRHKAIIVGAGRIGTGFDWPETPYIYTHADAYLALKKRVELVGIVDTQNERLAFARKKYRVPTYGSVTEAIEKEKPDIVSICTPPSERKIIDLCKSVKGIWCEKPLAYQVRTGNPLIQVNYIRRFDPLHRWFLGSCGLQDSTLAVWAKMDVHTVCHFTNLARFWEVKKLIYNKNDGPCTYQLYLPGGHHVAFPNGGVVGEFMENALGNLIDAVEENAELVSPPGLALDSEKWADDILKGYKNANS